MTEEVKGLMLEIVRLRELDATRKRISQTAEQAVRDLKFLMYIVSKNLKEELESLKHAYAGGDRASIERAWRACTELLERLEHK
jgi:hypothetical protein